MPKRRPRISKAELHVMRALWESSKPMTRADLRQLDLPLSASMLNYSITHLTKKGLIEVVYYQKQEVGPPAGAYIPKIAEGEYEKVLKGKLWERDRSNPILSTLVGEKESRDVIERLEKELERLRAEKK